MASQLGQGAYHQGAFLSCPQTTTTVPVVSTLTRNGLPLQRNVHTRDNDSVNLYNDIHDTTIEAVYESLKDIEEAR